MRPVAGGPGVDLLLGGDDGAAHGAVGNEGVGGGEGGRDGAGRGPSLPEDSEEELVPDQFAAVGSFPQRGGCAGQRAHLHPNPKTLKP